MRNNTTLLFKYNIFNGSLNDTISLTQVIFSQNSSPFFVACANPHSLVVASKDEHFKQALNATDILLPDGSGIVLAAKILKKPLQGKIAGTDFFLGLMQDMNHSGGGRVFFLGSSETVLNLIKKRVKKDFPKIEICGLYSPPFKTSFSPEENNRMVQAVNAVKPDVLWVGMTAPKQEKWIYDNLDTLNIPVIGAIGAVFDFYAGTKKRSSDIWIRLGLEWLPRFLKEPRRLWERNLKSTPIFLGWILREKIKQITKGNI